VNSCFLNKEALPTNAKKHLAAPSMTPLNPNGKNPPSPHLTESGHDCVALFTSIHVRLFVSMCQLEGLTLVAPLIIMNDKTETLIAVKILLAIVDSLTPIIIRPIQKISEKKLSKKCGSWL